jgi:hypothetical protein
MQLSQPIWPTIAGSGDSIPVSGCQVYPPGPLVQRVGVPELDVVTTSIWAWVQSDPSAGPVRDGSLVVDGGGAGSAVVDVCGDGGGGVVGVDVWDAGAAFGAVGVLFRARVICQPANARAATNITATTTGTATVGLVSLGRVGFEEVADCFSGVGGTAADCVSAAAVSARR